MKANNEIALRFFDSKEDPTLKRLIESQVIISEVDTFEHGLEEFFDITHPWLRPNDTSYQATRQYFIEDWKSRNGEGVWIYYPWLRSLVHAPPESVFIKLRTSRNRNLVTEAEQSILQAKCVGIAGMSVGSNILNTLVLTGGPRHLKIADLDIISIPNLNRIMAPITSVGMNKAVYFARKCLEVDPYLKIDVYASGLNIQCFDSFFKAPKLDLFIEEMDNPFLKIASRKVARELKIPVIMAADNGDGALIDVERFDTEPDRELFHGRLRKYNLNKITEKISFSQKLSLIADMVHLEEATPRAQDSLGEVGTKLNTWPQLGTAALMAGVSLTFIARQILLNQPMSSGRYAISLEDKVVPSYNAPSETRVRARHTKAVMQAFRNFQAYLEEVEKL